MTVREALRHGAALLEAAGVDSPRLDARLLLSHATGLSRGALLDGLRMVDPTRYSALLTRRAGREPLAFILGRQEFWSLDFEVSPATLIPRADSETVIEAAIAALPERGRVLSILDLGTGTGCLLLAALTEFRAAWGFGVDRSVEAVALAARNAFALGLAGRAAFLCGDWDSALSGRFDLVLSNPPYIPTADIAGLMPEVALHEPGRALDGGVDGLAAYRHILAALPRLLAPGGAAVLEIGMGQAGPVAALVGGPVVFRADLAGIPRAVVVRT